MKRGTKKLRFAWLLEEERMLRFQEGVGASQHFTLVFSINTYNNCGNNYNQINNYLRKSQNY